jgi:hypothetical protein
MAEQADNSQGLIYVKHLRWETGVCETGIFASHKCVILQSMAAGTGFALNMWVRQNENYPKGHYMMKRLLIVAAVFGLGCGSEGGYVPTSDAGPGATDSGRVVDGVVDGTVDQGTSPTVVYVTLAGHIEDGVGYGKCETYPNYRKKLLGFAANIHARGLPMNMQIERTFLEGANNCETDQLKANTDGLNIIDYLVTKYGFEIDAHREGGWEEEGYNYADVRYLGGLLTSAMSDVVGGFVWQDGEQIARLAAGEKGEAYPDFFWEPKILSLAVGTDHHNGNFSLDDMTSGIWQPKGGNDDFLTHDGANKLIYVGPGLQHSDWNQKGNCALRHGGEYAALLLKYLDEGKIPKGKIYTTTIAIPQKVMLKGENIEVLNGMLDQLAPLAAEGKVVFTTYSNVVDIWQKEFNSEPHIFTFDNIDPQDYTCK